MPLHLRNCYSHPLRLSHLVSLLCISLPPVLAGCALSLFLSPLLSQTLCWQSQGCSVVNYLCDLFLVFISTLPHVIWDKWWVDEEGERETERRRTHGLSHSVTTWCGWRELAAAGSVMCYHQCQRFILWPEQLLYCKRGKLIASSCAIFALGNCCYYVLVEALTRNAINTSNFKKQWTRRREQREKKTKSIRQQEAPINQVFCLYAHADISSVKLLPLEGFFQSPRRTRGVCTDSVTLPGLPCRGPGLTLLGEPRWTCFCFESLLTAVWEMTGFETTLPMAPESLL